MAKEEPKKKEGFWSTLKVLLFKEESFKVMIKISSWALAVLFFIVCILFQSMPTSQQEIALFFNMAAFYAIKFIICLAIIFIFMRVLGSKTTIKGFVGSTSLTYTYAMVLSMILAYASILLFDMLLKISVISGVVKSFIPYYTSVLFGWCCESVSGIEKKWKAVAIGLFSITLLLIYILYIDPLLCNIGFINAFGIQSIFCGG